MVKWITFLFRVCLIDLFALNEDPTKSLTGFYGVALPDGSNPFWNYMHLDWEGEKFRIQEYKDTEQVSNYNDAKAQTS